MSAQDRTRRRARFVALEGIDGAGKNTLTEGLFKRAEAAGLKCARLAFPRYTETAFGRLVAAYLNGEFGGIDEVSPDFAALLYAGDRYESRDVIEAALAENDLVIADRYVASNAAYNSAKLAEAARAAFIDRFEKIEHEVFGLPRPDLYLLLEIAPATSAELVARKGERDYTDKAADLHEADRAYLAACAAVYDELAARDFGAPWLRVPVEDAAGSLRTPDDIAEQVWGEMAARLSLAANASKTES